MFYAKYALASLLVALIVVVAQSTTLYDPSALILIVMGISGLLLSRGWRAQKPVAVEEDGGHNSKH